MEPFKNLFNKELIEKLCIEISRYDNNFDKLRFKKLALNKLETLEMKDRVRQISESFDTTASGTTRKKISVIKRICKSEALKSFQLWPFSQFIEENGLECPKLSLEALYYLTKIFTAEFAIRPFLIQEPHLTYEYLSKWVHDPCEHIRRLVSEGTRPNLPWGIKIHQNGPKFKKNIKLLRILKDDPAVYVQKSVANHLNDLSRVAEELFIKELIAWNRKPIPSRVWVIRHASRTLLKKGNSEILSLHGYSTKDFCAKLQIKEKSILEGESLNIAVEVKSSNPKDEKIIVDYIVHYVKANGCSSEKVFRLKDTSIASNSNLLIEKKISFKKVTTRKHYSGNHRIEIQINGIRKCHKSFNLSV